MAGWGGWIPGQLHPPTPYRLAHEAAEIMSECRENSKDAEVFEPLTSK